MNKFTNRVPCLDDVGKIFWMQHRDGNYKTTRIAEIRKDENGRLFVCSECNDGWEKLSYGSLAELYRVEYTWMAGPIEIPEGVR